MPFASTLLKVFLMLIYALPGYIFVKFKIIRVDCTKDLSKILMYICQPCLELYSFNKVVEYSGELLPSLALFFSITLIAQIAAIFLLKLIFKRKQSDSAYRIATVAGVFGNFGFFGTPLLETLLPDYPQAVVYAAVLAVSMNAVAWTVGLFVMTGEKQYMRPVKALLCPNVAALAIVLPLFITGTALPSVIAEPVELMGRISLPLCMFVCGMRLAVSDLKKIFTSPSVYVTMAIKLVLLPLVVLGITHLLPISQQLRTTVFILCCCPTAALVQSLAEIFDGDRAAAAADVLAADVLCGITIPLLCMLV